MTADDETALKWVQDDYVREEMESERRALEEGGVDILDDSDEEAPRPSNPIGHDDPVHGCTKDGGGVQDDDGDDDGGNYTNFYKLLGMYKAAASGDSGDLV